MRSNLDITLFLVRHGQTNRNTSNFIGQAHDEPLNSTGEAQAKLLGERLRKEVVFDSIFCSSMLRAQSTLDIAKPKVSGLVSTGIKELREIEQGDAQHKARTEVFAEPELWERYIRNGMGFAFPNGESQYDVAHRARGFVDREILDNAYTRTDKPLNVAIISHGMTTKALLWSFLQWEPGATGRCLIENVSISKVHIKRGTVFLEGINDTAHLRVS